MKLYLTGQSIHDRLQEAIRGALEVRIVSYGFNPTLPVCYLLPKETQILMGGFEGDRLKMEARRVQWAFRERGIQVRGVGEPCHAKYALIKRPMSRVVYLGSWNFAGGQQIEVGYIGRNNDAYSVLSRHFNKLWEFATIVSGPPTSPNPNILDEALT